MVRVSPVRVWNEGATLAVYPGNCMQASDPHIRNTGELVGGKFMEIATMRNYLTIGWESSWMGVWKESEHASCTLGNKSLAL